MCYKFRINPDYIMNLQAALIKKISMSKQLDTESTLPTSLNPGADSGYQSVLKNKQGNEPQKMIDEEESFKKDVLKHDIPYRNDSRDSSIADSFCRFYQDQQPLDLQSLFDQQDPLTMMKNLSNHSNDQLSQVEVRSVQESHQEGFRTSITLEYLLMQQSIDSSTSSTQKSRTSSSDRSSSSSSSNDEEDEQRSYLKGKRRPKGSIQGQYPTKNLLPTAKKIHLDFILAVKGPNYLKRHPELQAIFSHRSAVRKEFTKMYKYKDLAKVWEEFFSKKVIYRKLRESKTRPEIKTLYLKYLDSFEYVFLTGKFVRLTVCRSEELRMLKLQREQAM